MNEVLMLVVGFALCFISYRTGIKDGQRTRQDKPIGNIIKPLKKANNASEYDDEILKGIENIMSYDGTEQEVKR